MGCRPIYIYIYIDHTYSYMFIFRRGGEAQCNIMIFFTHSQLKNYVSIQFNTGGGPGAVVEAACLKSRRPRVRAPLWPTNFKESKCYTKIFFTFYSV